MLSRRFGSRAEWLTFKVPGIGRGSSGLAGLAVFGAVENAGGLDNSNTTDTRQAAGLYFLRQAQATFECIASEFLGSALGFYVPWHDSYDST